MVQYFAKTSYYLFIYSNFLQNELCCLQLEKRTPSNIAHAQEFIPGFFGQRIRVAQSKSEDAQICALMGVRKPAVDTGREMNIWKDNQIRNRPVKSLMEHTC